MNQENILGLLNTALGEVAGLRQLRHGNQEFDLWFAKVCDLLEIGLGKKSTEYERFARAVTVQSLHPSDAEQQKAYLRELDAYETALKSIIQKQELRASLDGSGIGQAPKPKSVAQPPSAFIAHGGETPALNKVEEFLSALGVTPVIAEKQPTESRSVDQQVTWCMDKCDCAVILATKGDVDGHTGELVPRGNVSNEIGRCQERFPGKNIYLLEQDTRFPSNISEKVWERFTQDNMESAFLKIARELVAFGLIRTMKPS